MQASRLLISFIRRNYYTVYFKSYGSLNVYPFIYLVQDFLWIFKQFFHINDFPQISHVYFGWPCFVWCCFNPFLFLKYLLHSVHSIIVLLGSQCNMCLLSERLYQYDLWHIWHLKRGLALSLLWCFKLCDCNTNLLENGLSQTWQLYL